MSGTGKDGKQKSSSSSGKEKPSSSLGREEQSSLFRKTRSSSSSGKEEGRETKGAGSDWKGGGPHQEYSRAWACTPEWPLKRTGEPGEEKWI